MPTLVATPWPSGPVVVSTPDTQWYSGCPGALLSSWRKRRMSSRPTLAWPKVSYSAFTACVLVRCSAHQSSIEACPLESTKRSRLGQIGSCGSKRMARFQIVYTSGASAMGVPGCPELAACTASIESVRMVLMHVRSRSLFACIAGFLSNEASVPCYVTIDFRDLGNPIGLVRYRHGRGRAGGGHNLPFGEVADDHVENRR